MARVMLSRMQLQRESKGSSVLSEAGRSVLVPGGLKSNVSRELEPMTPSAYRRPERV